MKDNEKKTEELLVDMAKLDETKNKKLFINMVVLLVTSVLFYLGIVFLAAMTLEEGFTLGAIIVSATLLLVFIFFYALSIEIKTGYYECGKCHERFSPKANFRTLFSANIGFQRILKCPLAKKVMGKNE